MLTNVKNLRKVNHNTLKLSKVKRLPYRSEPNRIKYEFVTARTALELFDYFCVFLKKKFDPVRSNELQNELNMMHSSGEDIE